MTEPFTTPDPDGAAPPQRAGNAPGGDGGTTERSPKAPAEHDPFRPEGDPELSEGPKAPTTEAYGSPARRGLPHDDDAGASALVIGEALVDIVERPGEEPSEHPGGSPANVAVGLARLGRDVELVSWFGADAHGSLLRSHLELEEVRLSAASARASRTSTAHARLDRTGAATYAFDLEWAPPEPDPALVPLVLHTGSIAAVLEPGARTVAAAVARYRAHATISYDPNVRPDLMDRDTTRPVVEQLAARSDVVKVSDEDLGWLFPDEDPLAVARRWLTAGPALVIVTRGAEGAWAGTAEGVELTSAARAVEVVDTVGAGDSFTAGVLDGLWGADLLGADRRAELRAVDAATLQRILDHAGRIAAITVSREGANPPTRAELTVD